VDEETANQEPTGGLLICGSSFGGTQVAAFQF
jgi:hypothetical protein